MDEQFKYCTATEKRIAKAVVCRLINLGYELAIDDGEEIVTPITQDTKTLYDAMNSTEMDRVHAYVGGQHKGSALLVWGNGEDVLSDYSTSLEDALAGVDA
jgi:hypothetical protein